jgi:hypothetical protein
MFGIILSILQTLFVFLANISISSLVVGVIISSIVWFFVWRNNKKLFVSTLENVNKYLPETLPKEILDKVKLELQKFGLIK